MDSLSDARQQTANGAAKPKRDRPKTRVDLELVEKSAHFQYTRAETAATSSAA